MKLYSSSKEKKKKKSHQRELGELLQGKNSFYYVNRNISLLA